MPLKDREARLAYLAKWRAEHPDAAKEWRANNPDRALAQGRKRRSEHPEAVRDERRRSEQKNKVLVRRRTKQWALDNPDRMRVLRRNASLRRRAVLAGAVVERVNTKAVFDSDGWICGICQLPVDESLVYPDPHSPSLDHIVPLKMGGSHTLANVQLAHLSCNNGKGSRFA